jgi:hypothetical protein
MKRAKARRNDGEEDREQGRCAAPSLPELGDEEEADTIIPKVITAHGGAEKLAKHKTIRGKYEGFIMINNVKCRLNGDIVYQAPDKFREVQRITNENGVATDVTNGFDGSKFWVSALGKLTEYTDKRLVDSARQRTLLDASSLGDFLKPPYEAANIGTQEVKGNNTIVIRVAKKGEPDFLFYINKKTHLIAKTQSTLFSIDLNRNSRHEHFILSYMDFDGIQTWKHVQDYRDGYLELDTEITSMTPLDQLDDGIFTKP